MPELAEVFYYSRQWVELEGLAITQILQNPTARIFREATSNQWEKLQGATLLKTETHGKKIRFIFDGSFHLHIHLGMTGKLYQTPINQPPQKHQHLILFTEQKKFIFQDSRMFGKATLLSEQESEKLWSQLPTAILSPDFNRKKFDYLIKRGWRKNVKAWLLSQDFFPGIGNWMADEILWRARINPFTRVNQIHESNMQTLYTIIQSVSRDALRVIGKKWGKPPKTWLFPHRWNRQGICPKTHQPLSYQTIAGRSTCFSPTWQCIP